MSKNKKKRNKRYQGEDAKPLGSPTSQPVVHRYQAVQRNAVGEWWHSRKKIIKPVSITVAIATVVVWLVVELIRAVF